MKKEEDAGQAFVNYTMTIGLILFCILVGLIATPIIALMAEGLSKLWALIPLAIGLLGAHDLYVVSRR